MKYSLQELETMPITLLRNVDIQTKEEEDLVQSIWNKRQANEVPIEVDLTITSRMTDTIKTPEDEARLQAQIDAKKAEAKAKLVPFVETPQIGGVDFAPVEKTEEVKKPFCNYCNSKGVRHKKECTRLSANLNTNV